MNKAKRILALLLALSLAAGMCACSPEESQESTQPVPLEKPESVGLGQADQQQTAAPVQHTSAGQASAAEFALALPALPEMAPYPNEEAFFKPNGEFDSDGFQVVYEAWEKTRRAQRDQAGVYAGKLNAYLTATAAEFLKSEEPGENAVCSPLNIWMALAMAAETAGGKTRADLLQLLGMGSIEETREVAASLWNANYCDDGACTSKMAASLWLNREVAYKQDTLEALAEHYYASGFQGDVTDPAYSAAFKDWLNENTGGLLQDAVASLPDFDPQMVLTLATAVYFRAAWANEFSAQNTYPEVFSGSAGEQEADFMHRSGTNFYYWSEHFGAVNLRFEDAGSMWFLLPDEGVSPVELLESGEAMDFLLSDYDARQENSKFLIVDMAVPKFDVESGMDLKARLKDLGLSDLFTGKADFTSLTDMDGVYISDARHEARVKIDEEGCEAAAFTVMMYAGSAMPPDERVEFKLDRPFLFALMSTDGLPLFLGVVNRL